MAIKMINIFLKLCPKNPALYSTKQPLKHCENAFSSSPLDEIKFLMLFTHIFITVGQTYVHIRSILRTS